MVEEYIHIVCAPEANVYNNDITRRFLHLQQLFNVKEYIMLWP